MTTDEMLSDKLFTAAELAEVWATGLAQARLDAEKRGRRNERARCLGIVEMLRQGYADALTCSNISRMIGGENDQ